MDAYRGHTLRDFARLEADAKFLLTELDRETDLDHAIAFERALIDAKMSLPCLADACVHCEALADQDLQKAWQVIREIRRLAQPYLAGHGGPEPYFFALLNATLPITYYRGEQFGEGKDREQWHKRYALAAAAMLCNELHPWVIKPGPGAGAPES